jgi:hypothetical protein
MNNEDKLIELIQFFSKKIDDEVQEAEKHRDEYAKLFDYFQHIEELAHDIKHEFYKTYFKTLVGKYISYEGRFFHLTDIDYVDIGNSWDGPAGCYADILEDIYRYNEDNGKVSLSKSLTIYRLESIQVIPEEDFNIVKNLYLSNGNSEE